MSKIESGARLTRQERREDREGGGFGDTKEGSEDGVVGRERSGVRLGGRGAWGNDSCDRKDNLFLILGTLPIG